jgi:hypothetical protein
MACEHNEVWSVKVRIAVPHVASRGWLFHGPHIEDLLEEVDRFTAEVRAAFLEAGLWRRG